ncbi:MAG: NADPH-dependent FMN reductase [Acidimicrobiales bacterium]
MPSTTTSSTPLRLALVTGSTREGRFGPVVADWFAGEVDRRSDLALDRIDLAHVDLPLHLTSDLSPTARAFLSSIDAADAVVVVTPEYNHGYPASLKQALDLGREEWARKPVGLVSYGARSGGIRAAEQLRQVFPEFEATTIRESIALVNAWSQFDDTGRPLDPQGLRVAADAMLDQLTWWAGALSTARAADAHRLSA